MVNRLLQKEERGFIKIVADEETDVILGAQMMCARATDMIGEFVNCDRKQNDGCTAFEGNACTSDV